MKKMILVLALLFGAGSLNAASVYYGSADGGATLQSVGKTYLAVSFTTANNFTINNIRIMVAALGPGNAADVVAGIYSNSAGKPDAQLCTTTAGAAELGSWTCLTPVATCHQQAGTYWLVAQGSMADFAVSKTVGSGGYFKGGTTWDTTLPTTFPAGSTTTNYYGIQADVTEDALTATPTFTETFTETFTPTDTPTVTDTFTDTATQTGTPTLTATPTWSDSPTETFTHTDTATMTATPTDTGTGTDTHTATGTATHTATGTATHTATGTDTRTVTGTNTPSFTETPSVTPTSTCTVTPCVTMRALYNGRYVYFGSCDQVWLFKNLPVIYNPTTQTWENIYEPPKFLDGSAYTLTTAGQAIDIHASPWASVSVSTKSTTWIDIATSADGNTVTAIYRFSIKAGGAGMPQLVLGPADIPAGTTKLILRGEVGNEVATVGNPWW